MHKPNWSKWAEFQEVMRLVAKYDWAVEGGYMPEDSKLNRKEAADLRAKLLSLLNEPETLPTFTVDKDNSNNEDFYVDILGKGSVLIKSNNDGVSVDIYPMHVADLPIFSGYVLNSDFEEVKDD